MIRWRFAGNFARHAGRQYIRPSHCIVSQRKKKLNKDLEMTMPSPERRANPRIDIDGEMSYRTGESGEMRTGKIENMSAGGALIWIEEELPDDSRLVIRVVSGELDDSPLEFLATLLYQMPETRFGLYGYGCRIETLPEAV
jgi:c-di-GMP-binding flagellar brake protein YcgR